MRKTFQKKLFEICEAEKQKYKRKQEEPETFRGMKEYYAQREKEVTAKEEILKILCGIDGITISTAEIILKDAEKTIRLAIQQIPLRDC